MSSERKLLGAELPIPFLKKTEWHYFCKLEELGFKTQFPHF